MGHFFLINIIFSFFLIFFFFTFLWGGKILFIFFSQALKVAKLFLGFFFPPGRKKLKKKVLNPQIPGFSHRGGFLEQPGIGFHKFFLLTTKKKGFCGGFFLRGGGGGGGGENP